VKRLTAKLFELTRKAKSDPDRLRNDNTEVRKYKLARKLKNKIWNRRKRKL